MPIIDTLTPLHMILYGLAVYRLTYMLVDEDGVFHLFDRVRAFANRHSQTLSEMLSCKFCTSVWVSLGVCLALYLNTPLTQWFCLWLALSGITVVLVRLVR